MYTYTCCVFDYKLSQCKGYALFYTLLYVNLFMSTNDVFRAKASTGERSNGIESCLLMTKKSKKKAIKTGSRHIDKSGLILSVNLQLNLGDKGNLQGCIRNFFLYKNRNVISVCCYMRLGPYQFQGQRFKWLLFYTAQYIKWENNEIACCYIFKLHNRKKMQSHI